MVLCCKVNQYLALPICVQWKYFPVVLERLNIDYVNQEWIGAFSGAFNAARQ